MLVFPLSGLDVWTLARSSKGLQEQAERLLCVITGAQDKYARRRRDFAETYDFMAKVEWILWGPNIFMKRNPMRDNSFLLFGRATRAHIGTICCTLGFLVRNPPAPAKVWSINSLILWRSSSHYLQRHYSPHTGLEPVLCLVGRWKRWEQS